MDKSILKKWLKAGYMESGRLNPTDAGTPQGGIISPVLSNWALDGLEAVLETHFGKKNTKASYKTKVNYVRYADDFVITGISKELLVERVKPLVEAFMAERGLTLSAEKTLITHITDGFDFLGQNHRKYKGKLLIKPSPKSLRAVLTKIKAVIVGNKTAPAWMLIHKLNPIIRGWVNYHKGVVSKETFKYLDYRIWKLIWKWCRRRHSNRRKRWVKEKYFPVVGKRKWVFSALYPGGKPARLVYAADTPIKRHTKIKALANPYDPEFEMYFEDRLEYAWKNSEQGKRKTYTLWNRQQKRCPMCNQYITFETGWHVHHVHFRGKGGSDKLDNLVMLHPSCHRKLHAKNLKTS
jgi:RNA-directed DNA polymerase